VINEMMSYDPRLLASMCAAAAGNQFDNMMRISTNSSNPVPQVFTILASSNTTNMTVLTNTLGIKKVNSTHFCYAGSKCKRKTRVICEGEVAVYMLTRPGGAYQHYPALTFVYWHPECFLDAEIENEKGVNIVKKIIITFLPLLIGEDNAKPIVLALDMDTDWSRG
jgi:hypothetical protein